MSTLLDSIATAEAAGTLLDSSAENIRKMLARGTSPLAEAVIGELAQAGCWDELNNRFFRAMAFGTGGLRGKTIGEVVTKTEAGLGRPDGRPEHACIGTNAMNDYNIARATRGLATYVRQWHERENRPGRPSIAISYDTRFFSREFADLAAKVMTDLGCDALLFEGPRSTPELSFAVRYKNAAAGINITASHNPPGYNGYKVYFDDGGQVVAPHDQGIIDLVNAGDDSYEPLPEGKRGKVIKIGREIDEAYMARLEKLIVDPELFRRTPPLKTVFTPLHGVGGVIIVPMLHRLGVECWPVPSQMVPDGLFPTVKSPNPEYPEALKLGMELAEIEKEIMLAPHGSPKKALLSAFDKDSGFGDVEDSVVQRLHNKPTGAVLGALKDKLVIMPMDVFFKLILGEKYPEAEPMMSDAKGCVPGILGRLLEDPGLDSLLGDGSYEVEHSGDRSLKEDADSMAPACSISEEPVKMRIVRAVMRASPSGSGKTTIVKTGSLRGSPAAEFMAREYARYVISFAEGLPEERNRLTVAQMLATVI